MNRGAALIGALLATLETPATWPLALAAFLVRGGIVLVAGPDRRAADDGRVRQRLRPGARLDRVRVDLDRAGRHVRRRSALAVVAWIVFGGWLAAALEAEAAWMVAGDEDVRALGRPRPRPACSGTGPTGTARVAARILVARLIAYIPLAVVLAVGTVRVVLVTYRELTSPLDTSTPIVLRVLRGTPEVVVAVVVAWTLGEMVGGDRRPPDRPGRRRRRVGAARRDRHVPPPSDRVGLIRFWLPTAVLFGGRDPVCHGRRMGVVRRRATS